MIVVIFDKFSVWNEMMRHCYRHALVFAKVFVENVLQDGIPQGLRKNHFHIAVNGNQTSVKCFVVQLIEAKAVCWRNTFILRLGITPRLYVAGNKQTAVV